MPDPSLRAGHRALVAVVAVDAQAPVFDALPARRMFGRRGNRSRSRRGSGYLEQLAEQNGAFWCAARAACPLMTARRAEVPVRPGGRGALRDVRGAPRRSRINRLLRHSYVSLAPAVGQLTGPPAGSRDSSDGLKCGPRAERHLSLGKSRAVQLTRGWWCGDVGATSLDSKASASPRIDGPRATEGEDRLTSWRAAGEFWAAGEKLPGRDQPWVGLSPRLS